MLRNARLIIGVCLLAGVSLTTVIAWSTGLIERIVSTVAGIWEGIVTWLSSPMSWEHFFAGAGVLLVPLIILVVISVIADG